MSTSEFDGLMLIPADAGAHDADSPVGARQALDVIANNVAHAADSIGQVHVALRGAFGAFGASAPYEGALSPITSEAPYGSRTTTTTAAGYFLLGRWALPGAVPRATVIEDRQYAIRIRLHGRSTNAGASVRFIVGVNAIGGAASGPIITTLPTTDDYWISDATSVTTREYITGESMGPRDSANIIVPQRRSSADPTTSDGADAAGFRRGDGLIISAWANSSAWATGVPELSGLFASEYLLP